MGLLNFIQILPNCIDEFLILLVTYLFIYLKIIYFKYINLFISKKISLYIKNFTIFIRTIIISSVRSLSEKNAKELSLSSPPP